MVVAETEETGHLRGHLVGGPGQHLLVVATQETGLGRGCPGAPALDETYRGVDLVADREPESDPGPIGLGRDHGRDRAAVVETGDGAVEGEGHAVDHTRLP